MRYFETIDATRAFAGDHEGDFDLDALRDVLFEPAYAHPEYGEDFVEREYTDAEIEACDVTSWQTCFVQADDYRMFAERWFHSPKHGPVHVGAWTGEAGQVSLTLATVERGGLSPWNSGCEFIADSTDPGTWGELDYAYGSRAAWLADLAAVESLIK